MPFCTVRAERQATEAGLMDLCLGGPLLGWNSAWVGLCLGEPLPGFAKPRVDVPLPAVQYCTRILAARARRAVCRACSIC